MFCLDVTRPLAKGSLEDVIILDLGIRSQYILLEVINARTAAKMAVIAALS